MTELAALLELLYTAHSRWRTVHATLRDWTHLERTHLAYERHLERSRATHGPSVAAGAYGHGPGQYPPELELSLELWLDEHGRFREERADHSLTLVSDGERTLLSSPESGVIQHETQAMRPTADSLLAPVALIPALLLTPAGETTVLGRRALVVEARPRLPARHAVDLVPDGCDEVTFNVDAERGIVLRLEARFDGAPTRVVELTSLVLDAAIPRGRFTLELPSGETVRTADEAYPVRHETLEGAARAASFTVWSPSRLPGRWRATVVYRPATERPSVPESVMLIFADTESLHYFGIEQAAEHLLAWRVGGERVIEREGLELTLVGGDTLPGPPLEIHRMCGATHVRLYSDNLDQDALLDIAASLAPAPTEPPPTVE